MWPGVATIWTVVSPRISFVPSAPTATSRFGTPPVAVAGRFAGSSQSGVPHHDLRAVALLQLRGALVVVAMGVAG